MKNYQQQNLHTSFGISIFQCPQEIIALNISLFKLVNQSTSYLNTILKRTKSPPISALYTFQFLKTKDEAEIQLSIIRFISQLSDLSVGKSMQSSLAFLQNGSFLTQLRHNLTHRVMLKGVVIQKAKQIILKQLSQKYWNQMTSNIWNMDLINNEKVVEYYKKIYKSQLSKQSQQNNKVYFKYLDNLQNQERFLNNFSLLQNLNNYKYKKVIQIILKRLIYNDSQSKQFEVKIKVQEIIPKSHFKLIIFMCNLIEIFLKFRSKKHLDIFSKVINFIKINSQQEIWKQKLVLKKIRKFYFLQYLEQFQKVINILPQSVKKESIIFWDQKSSKLKKSVLFNNSIQKKV